jgi:hypothetical protein
METPTFLALSLVLLGFGLFSGRLSRTILTAPILFVIFGLLLGPLGTGIV